MVVKHSNRPGRAYKQAGSATITVDPRTKVPRQGAHKADLAGGAMPDLTARKVGAHPAKAA
jgi:hypothetical protein